MLLAVRLLYESEYAFSVILFLLGFGVVSSLKYLGTKHMEIYVSEHFRFFFYVSALLFGLLHATNFNGSFFLILALSPILVGPQIIGGLILGYVRMKHGLVYSILFHAAGNILTLYLSMKP